MLRTLCVQLRSGQERTQHTKGSMQIARIMPRFFVSQQELADHIRG